MENRQRRVAQILHARRDALREKRKELSGSAAAKLTGDIGSLQWRAINDFPGELNLVLPTRLGNRVRCFERYADDRYRFETITLWPRMLQILPDRVLEQLRQEHAGFELMVNLTLLIQVLGVELVASAALNDQIAGGWIWIGLATLIVSYLPYRGAYGSALVWGHTFNATIDLYRRSLMARLGYEPPSTLAEERELWIEIGHLVHWGRMPRRPLRSEPPEPNPRQEQSSD